MVYQTDFKLNSPLMKYGCLFLSIAFAREYLRKEPWEAKVLLDAWDQALEKGIISGDINLDGDLDDSGEAEIQDYPGILALLKVPLRWGRFGQPNEVISTGTYVIGAFYNPTTKFKHFAVVDHNKKVIYDPIRGGSITCRDGYLESLRLFTIT